MDRARERLGDLAGMTTRHAVPRIQRGRITRTLNEARLFLVAYTDRRVQPVLFHSLRVKNKLVVGAFMRNLGFTSLLMHVCFHGILPLHA